MDNLQFVHLSQIPPKQIIDLMNIEKVGKQMPLLSAGFSMRDCQKFLQAKRQLWETHGYGPWAFIINGNFAGWGGLQAERGDADFALVLHPNYWGWGKRIFVKIKDQAFNELNLKSITILLPPTRLNTKALKRIGFIKDTQLNIKGEVFMRFRLLKH